VSSKGFIERIWLPNTDGPALTNSTAQTSLMPTAFKTIAFPVGDFDEPTRIIRFGLHFRISTVVTTPGTLALAIRLGSTDIFTSGLMTLNVVAKTNVPAYFSGELHCRAVGGGTSTTFFPIGCLFISEAVIGSPAPTAGGAGVHILPYNTAPAVGTGVDNAPAHALDVLGTWSVQSASNSITLHGGFFDRLT
jgi:hypothetical protein